MTDLIGSFGLVFIASAAVFGPLSGWLAGRRDRHPIVWFAFGALLGPIAVLLLLAAPPGRCWMCDTPILGWVSICAACGAPLTNAAGAGRFPGTQRWPSPVTTTAAKVSLRSSASSLGVPAVPVLTMLRSRDVEAAPAPGPSPEAALSQPIVLPIGRPARSRRPEVPDRPPVAGTLSRSSPETDAGGSEVLATAVYFGGTAGLTVGARYVIVRHDPVLRLLGPVDLDPTRVALERPLARLAAASVGERLIITERGGGRVALALGLGALAGMSGPQLELALTAREPSTEDRRPASG